MTTTVRRMDPARSQLLVVDIQDKLLPHIHEGERVIRESVRMIRAAKELGLPITVSEQYPQGLGPTNAAVREALGEVQPIIKATFSTHRDAKARAQLTKALRPQVLLVGIEAHVCVQQTALDLLDAQMAPFVLADAVSSRRERDCEIALARMRSAGVVVSTVEAAIFEMLDRSDTELFKRLLKLVR